MNLVSIKEGHGLGYSLTAHQRAVEAFQIADDKLFTGFFDLGVTSRNHRGRGVDYYFAFRIAAEARYIAIQIDALDPFGSRVN